MRFIDFISLFSLKLNSILESFKNALRLKRPNLLLKSELEESNIPSLTITNHNCRCIRVNYLRKLLGVLG